MCVCGGGGGGGAPATHPQIIGELQAFCNIVELGGGGGGGGALAQLCC